MLLIWFDVSYQGPFLLFVGASKHLDQYFNGYLAGLTVLKDATESDRVIRCLNDCKEKLDFHAMSEMETGMVR